VGFEILVYTSLLQLERIFHIGKIFTEVTKTGCLFFLLEQRDCVWSDRCLDELLAASGGFTYLLMVVGVVVIVVVVAVVVIEQEEEEEQEEQVQ